MPEPPGCGKFPAEWRPRILKNYLYAASCFLYLLPILTWHDADRIRSRFPYVSRFRFGPICDFATLSPYFFANQALLSFLGDYVYICLPSWTGAVLDPLSALFGTSVTAVGVMFETFSPEDRFLASLALLSGVFTFSMSARASRVHGDLEARQFWHILWHCSLPFSFTALGYKWLYSEGEKPVVGGENGGGGYGSGPGPTCHRNDQ